MDSECRKKKPNGQDCNVDLQEEERLRKGKAKVGDEIKASKPQFQSKNRTVFSMSNPSTSKGQWRVLDNQQLKKSTGSAKLGVRSSIPSHVDNEQIVSPPQCQLNGQSSPSSLYSTFLIDHNYVARRRAGVLLDDEGIA
ncbi:unnamed protein product [Ilex paraguariensis]|uniref:Uncharacterized protein n=1 Tax=Ilex paraguariensis TaxID=185542 RepID=A0ABC8RHW2_9AQUA